MERVYVDQREQTIIDQSEKGGGADEKKLEQAHGKIAYAPQPTLPSEDQEGDVVPMPRDAERKV